MTAPQTLVQGDGRVLLSLFRSALADTPAVETPLGAAAVLHDLAVLLRDTGPAGGYVQQVVTDHGPAVLLRALADAYDHPQEELVYDVEYP